MASLKYNSPVTSKELTCLAFLFTICLSSCDPGIGVVIANNTPADKKIKVIYPPEFKFPSDSPHDLSIRDSIKTFDLSVKDNFLHPIVIPIFSWDTVARNYSFILKANYKALVEDRFLTALPTFGQVFIIDDTDTVKLIRRGKDFKKKPKLLLGGTWTHKIISSE